MARIAGTDLVDTEDLAHILGVTRASLTQMRYRPDRHRTLDGIPAPLRLISGRPVWLRADIDRWQTDRAAHVS